MLDIRDFLINHGESDALVPQSISRLKNSKRKRYVITNQYEDSYLKEYHRLICYGIDVDGFVYANQKISAIPFDSEEIHEFFGRLEEEVHRIDVIACFNAIKNQDLLKYISEKECVKNVYILDGYAYKYGWQDASWIFRGGVYFKKVDTG